jgi:hypothetical protein
MLENISNPKDKIKLCAGMRDFGLDFRKSNKCHMYEYQYDVLKLFRIENIGFIMLKKKMQMIKIH